ncbi:MAG: LD-carboxypeptidase [Lachnospiraceae bacterium]|nr:LD-carboxypeptidase [Lachnospiraceae bacterium]
MRFPTFLKENDTIGFVAPSFGCNIEPYRSAFENACRNFQNLGYQLEFGPNCFAGDGIGISSTPEKCGRELTEYYGNSSNQALISCGGGELMCSILDYVDFELLKQASPKWYMGYSDNTNFTFLLTTILDTASIYGPCAPAFGMEPWHPAISDAWNILTGDKLNVENYTLWEKESQKDESHPLAPYHTTEPEIFHTFLPVENQNSGESEILMNGRLLGGCMDCLVNLLGTKYDFVAKFNEKYQSDGIIWFLESCDLNIMSIYRAIWQMQHAGWFQHVKGFLFGRPLCFGQTMFGMDQYRAVTELLAQYNVPIIMDLDIGHLPPAMPLICGSLAEVKARENHISIKMSLK